MSELARVSERPLAHRVLSRRPRCGRPPRCVVAWCPRGSCLGQGNSSAKESAPCHKAALASKRKPCKRTFFNCKTDGKGAHAPPRRASAPKGIAPPQQPKRACPRTMTWQAGRQHASPWLECVGVWCGGQGRGARGSWEDNCNGGQGTRLQPGKQSSSVSKQHVRPRGKHVCTAHLGQPPFPRHGIAVRW